MLTGFYQNNESFFTTRRSVSSDQRPPQRLHDGTLDETDLPLTDVYLQDFYLYCLNLLLAHRKTFVESKEGYTYIPQEKEDMVSQRILTFV